LLASDKMPEQRHFDFHVYALNGTVAGSYTSLANRVVLLDANQPKPVEILPAENEQWNDDEKETKKCANGKYKIN
jgi:hypothetical protein